MKRLAAIVTIAMVAIFGHQGPVIAADLQVVGPPATVFAWASDRCAPNHIPDAPARAFRDSTGQVHLFASHNVNRAQRGPGLDALRADCAVVFQGSRRDDPGAYDDFVWLTAFYTEDGETVQALGHAEFHGNLRRDLCPAAQYMACWRNAVIGAVSRDRGLSFARAGTVATLPYRYDPSPGRPTGYFSPSNIIAVGAYRYAFVFAEAYEAQRRGPCLLRTERIDDPAAWRAWDGRDFTIAFVDPYRGAVAKPDAHVCAPIPGIGSTVGAVVRQTGSGAFIAVTAAVRAERSGEPPVPGIWYATSRDLVRWSPPRLLMKAPLMFAFGCGDKEVFAYPSLLDPDSPSRNFDTVGDRAFLYLTRFNMTDCKLPMNRDLVRYKVTIAP